MTDRHVKDLAASIRQRLHNHAKATGRPFQEVLQYFAMERFLYRLSRSPHVDEFVLKGALMFAAWRSPASRPTKDIDLLSRTSNDVAAVVAIIREICLSEVEPDGLVFDVASLHGTHITEEASYVGIPPFALTSAFALDSVKMSQWRGFLRRSRITIAPTNLTEIVDALAAFLMPLAQALGEHRIFSARWAAPGPWRGLE
jgi:hypothetical protein